MSESELNSQHPGAEPSVESQMISPGARLAAYRQERGWTVEQVASQLNLAPRQIVAIEADDYPSLPGMAIVRGFIRAYAKLLKVDAAPLLASLGGETVLVHESIQPRKTLSAPFSEARLPSMSDRQGLSSKWVIGILLVLLIGVGVWAVRQSEQPVDGARAPAAKAVEAQASPVAGTNGMPAPAPAGEQRIAAPASPSLAPVGEQAAQPVPPPAMPATPAAPGPGASAAAPAPEPRAPSMEPTAPVGKDMLALNVREDSWIEIRRADTDAVLLSRIVKAGETANIEISQPVSVVIGNASGVDVALRGTPIELKPKTSNNVARLNLK